jgi:hypothetical protein
MIRNIRGMVSAARDVSRRVKQAGCTSSLDQTAGLRGRVHMRRKQQREQQRRRTAPDLRASRREACVQSEQARTDSPL